MRRMLGVQEIEDIAVGAAVLGSGGGGDPFIGKLDDSPGDERYGPVELVTPDELPGDSLAVSSAMMGAPTIVVEKIPNGEETGRALASLSSYLGREVAAIVSIEAGGMNSMLPLALSARLGLPTLDFDGMGRAFPELQMVPFELAGISATPMILADEKGNQSLLQTIDNLWTERLARTDDCPDGRIGHDRALPDDGAASGRPRYSGRDLAGREAGPGAAGEARHSNVPAADALVEAGHGRKLFTGKITDVLRRSTDAFVRGDVTIEGIDELSRPPDDALVPEREPRRSPRWRGGRIRPGPARRARRRDRLRRSRPRRCATVCG